MRHIIDKEGDYSFIGPFADIAEPGTYFIERVESFASYRKDGGSISEIYNNPGFNTPIADVDAVMEADEADGVQLLTMKDRSGVMYHMPDKYVSIIDLSTGLLYGNKTIVVNIAGHPINNDHNDIVSEIDKLIIGMLGVKPQIEVMVTSKEKYVKGSDHKLINIARKLKRDTTWNSTDKLKKELAQAKATIAAMEACCKP